MDGIHCRKQIIAVFLKVVTAMNPANLIPESLRLNKNMLHVCDKSYDITDSNVNLIGFGKAVLGMASQCEKILSKHLKRGIICIPEGVLKTFENTPSTLLKSNSVIQVYEGARNNLPDENSEKGTDAIINLIKSLNYKKDFVIVLISGGGSALFAKPCNEISLMEKKKLINLLLKSGADIGEINIVRKKISLVKGGGLAVILYPVKTICIILSDVINDSLDIIASGPTVPNVDSNNAAIDVIKKYDLTDKIPQNILKIIKSNNVLNKVPLQNNKFPHIDNFIIGNNVRGLKITQNLLEELNFATIILSSKIKGIVQNVANFYTYLLIEIINFINSNGNYNISFLNKNKPFGHEIICEDKFIFQLNKLMKEEFCTKKKIAIISGGETVVNVQGKGKGGRNQELVLIMLQKLYELKYKFSDFFLKFEVTFLSAGTDGIDGPTDVAGAIVDSKIFENFNINSSSINKYLNNNDSYNFYADVLNDSYIIRTGHTGTNVMDIHLLAIQKKN